MKIITIARDYGAGGHSIGKLVAEKLGIEYYDKDIISNTARSSGFEESFVAASEERYSGADSFIHSITPSYHDAKDAIFDFERVAILNLAKKGPCVFIGRYANFILREAGYDTLDVFLHADASHCSSRAAELIGSNDPAEIQKKMNKMNKARRSYCQHYIGKDFADMNNYDLSLDSGRLGYERCAEIICRAVKEE